MKYLVVLHKGEKVGFTFPRSVNHAEMLKAIRTILNPDTLTTPYKYTTVVSAGEVSSSGTCYSKSHTLDIPSTAGDEAIITAIDT
jgi:hypothetical protein